MATDFDVNALISEVTGGSDTSTTVKVADGKVSQAQGKSGAFGSMLQA